MTDNSLGTFHKYNNPYHHGENSADQFDYPRLITIDQQMFQLPMSMTSAQVVVNNSL